MPFSSATRTNGGSVTRLQQLTGTRDVVVATQLNVGRERRVGGDEKLNRCFVGWLHIILALATPWPATAVVVVLGILSGSRIVDRWRPCFNLAE